MEARILTTVWTFEPTVVIGLVMWTIGYELVIRRGGKALGEPAVPRARQLAFHLGTLAMAAALISPLDHLAETSLFSAHMVQHELLIFVSAPLWLLGLPDGFARARIPTGTRPALRWLTTPVTAFVISNAVLLAWHDPRAYDAAVRSETLHAVEHLTMLGAAVIGWWPVLGPSLGPATTLRDPMKLMYLFVMSFPGLALAAMLTFAGRVIYPFYASVPHPAWIPPLTDQRWGGLTMWTAGMAAYFLAIAVVFRHWMIQGEQLAQVDVPPIRRGEGLAHGGS